MDPMSSPKQTSEENLSSNESRQASEEASAMLVDENPPDVSAEQPCDSRLDGMYSVFVPESLLSMLIVFNCEIWN